MLWHLPCMMTPTSRTPALTMLESAKSTTR